MRSRRTGPGVVRRGIGRGDAGGRGRVVRPGASGGHPLAVLPILRHINCAEVLFTVVLIAFKVCARCSRVVLVWQFAGKVEVHSCGYDAWSASPR